MKNDSTACYVDWEEVVVSSDKGRKEFHYYLKHGGGARDLVVVGKEKSARRMSYRYVMKNNKLLSSVLSRFSRLKLRSRREVMDWLDSIISGGLPNGSIRRCGGEMNSQPHASGLTEDVMMAKVARSATKFTWLGSSWTCRKRRTHYQSFSRNGAVISVQDFVYILAEENKRLVAYLEDMYEDTRGNRMVVVRWFHRIEEVGFELYHSDNDKEIFFSLCLQDLSIECIDGLATVLSPEHYEKLLGDATRMGLAPFVCYRQFDNEEVKTFDVTRLKGYWNQEILRNMASSLEDVGFRPSKRVRWSKECESHLKSPENSDIVEASLLVSGGNSDNCKGDMKDCSDTQKNMAMPAQASHFLTVGSLVDVLSQDSGIRGCWFRALIIKKHKDKVKVQYRDLKDAIDESKNLEEWIFGSRLAAPDALGIRLSGRTKVRPTSPSDNASGELNVGSVVDAWWNDGWWEGIVMKKESKDRLHVYLPDEKHEIQLASSDLRPSKEWFNNSWHNFQERPDLVLKLSSMNKTPTYNTDVTIPSTQNMIKSANVDDKRLKNERQPLRDLTKDQLLTRLCWKSSGKRRCNRSPVQNSSNGNTTNKHSSSGAKAGFQTVEKLFVYSPMKFDSENCKYVSDSHFNSSVVSPLTNLVMSR